MRFVFMYSLSKLEITKENDCYDFDQIELNTRTRKIGLYNFFRKDRGIHKYMIGQHQFYSIDGSLRVEPTYFNQTAPKFFKKSRRTTFFRGQVHLRGTRYTISSNPTFELRQKMSSLSEDFYDGLLALQEPVHHPAYAAGIADYIKNSVLTVYNSFLYAEKIGKYQLDRLPYQRLRASGAMLVEAVVKIFYSHLGDYRKKVEEGLRFVVENTQVFERLKKRIIESYEDGVFSSRHMTRPEAAHPIIIAGAAAGYTQFSRLIPDVIIGLPSGSTELAFAHSLAQKIMKNHAPSVILFPVSLHSIKHDFDDEDANAITDELRAIFARRHKKLIENKTILIVDDNSSTGRTIDCVITAINECNPKFVDVAIAEADTIRSRLDSEEIDRCHIAASKAYSHSLNILPVSRKLRPKNDLKEIMERRKAISCLKSRYLDPDSSLQKQLIGKVYIDMFSNRTSDVVQKLNSNEIIDYFRHTFLSNFAEVEVEYNNKTFQSVEHAYQSMKFKGEEIGSISSKHFNQINRKLKARSTRISREDLPNLFVDKTISAGTSKVVGNQLRILGYVREDWDHAKVPIMIELVIQKFAKPEFWEQLQSTENKYLIEGNDWGDTFWGFDSGRGRNVLGRILMQIRDLDYETLVEAAMKVKSVETQYISARY